MNDNGFVCTGTDVINHNNWKPGNRPSLILETSVPGIFTAGNVRANSVKRVTSAVGEGGMAVNSVHRYSPSLKKMHTKK